MRGPARQAVYARVWPTRAFRGRRTMRRGVVAALAVALVLAARGFGGGAGDDRAKLQGAWKVTELDENGKPKPSAAGKQLTMVFEGDQFRMKGGDQEYDGTYKLDSTKTPKRIDTVVTGGTGKGKRT